MAALRLANSSGLITSAAGSVISTNTWPSLSCTG